MRTINVVLSKENKYKIEIVKVKEKASREEIDNILHSKYTTRGWLRYY